MCNCTSAFASPRNDENSEALHSALKSPACGGASGVNSQRSGFISSSGVSSRQSRPRTTTVSPSMPTSLTIDVPIGFGRTGERSENAPRVDLLFFRALPHQVAARQMQPIDHLEIGIKIDALQRRHPWLENLEPADR